ncbi:unnamed protein product [Schistosoma rodhaini]|uniref:Uncharacterized protein n=1 Tax=Schistosoma rodhaini TaxID=6188 RepID=A0AA85G735_9TREM|nr:unnamed protein product [Schistosoma rodhaini]
MERNYLMSCLIVILFVLFTEINGSGKAPTLTKPYGFSSEETTTETTTITTEDCEQPLTLNEMMLKLIYKLWAILQYLWKML